MNRLVNSICWLQNYLTEGYFTNKLCAWRHNMPPPLQVDNICSGITIYSYLFARWHLFRHVGYLRHQQQVNLGPFDLENDVRVTWATSVPILVFLGLSVLDLGPMYVTDRCQTKASLNASALWGGGIINPTKHEPNSTTQQNNRTKNLVIDLSVAVNHQLF